MIIDDLKSNWGIYRKGHGSNLTSKEIENILNTNPTVVRIDNVIQYFYQNMCNDMDYNWSMVKDIPNFAPVFKDAWFEWKYPSEFNFHSLQRGAVYLKYKKGIEQWIYDIAVFFQTLDGVFGFKDWSVVVNLDGTLDKDCLRGTDEYSNNVLGVLKFQILFAGMATSFLHCKNVNRIENTPSEKLQRSRIRSMKPPLTKHYVLQVMPMRSGKRSNGKSGTGDGVSLHICRGHFKNYQEGKGLFGKYHGLYWWEDFVKGNKEIGEVKKQYSIKIPK